MPGPNEDLAAGGFSMLMMMMIGWLVIATALFLLRPASLRRQSNEKPSGMVSLCLLRVLLLKMHMVTVLGDVFCAVCFNNHLIGL